MGTLNLVACSGNSLLMAGWPPLWGATFCQDRQKAYFYSMAVAVAEIGNCVGGPPHGGPPGKRRQVEKKKCANSIVLCSAHVPHRPLV